MADGRTIGGLRIRRLTGRALREAVGELARLRIEVFREFPYLYDGDLDYEAHYVETYIRSRDSAFVAVFDGKSIVGASTALPLLDETPNVIEPFKRHGFDPAKVFYYGESVLLRPYRGRGVGVVFFEEREAWARSLGRFSVACFCVVDRPADHPRRPPDYVPLDAFWRKRGFERIEGMETRFVWKELDEAEESPKRMLYWSKSLDPR